MSIFVSALADLTAGIAFQPVINGFAGVHKPDLYDYAVVNVAVGIADLLQIGRNAFFSRLTAVDAHIPTVMKRCRVNRPDIHFSHFIQCHGLLLSALTLSACILQESARLTARHLQNSGLYRILLSTRPMYLMIRRLSSVFSCSRITMEGRLRPRTCSSRKWVG